MTTGHNASRPTKPIGFAGEFRRPSVMSRTHQHQELELNYVTEGAMRYLIGGRAQEVPARRVCALWGASPHQVIEVEDATNFFWFTIPFSWLLQWSMPRELLDPLFRGEMLVARRDDFPDEALFHRWLADVQTGEPERLRAAQLEMEARLRRLALDGRDVRMSRGSRHAPALPVHRMAEVIAQRYTEDLSVAEIATAARLHPNYAMSLFKRSFGMSILEYLTQHRMFHARRLLATTDAKISDIAFASGFGSLNRFYSVFQQTNECSPRQYRLQFS